MATKKLSAIVIDALEDIKARDIKLINVAKLTSVFDYIAIASAESTRQTKALAKSVMDKVKQSGGWIYGIEGEQSGEWVLVDCGDVVVHIMQPAVREHYKLEELWGEGKLEFPLPVVKKVVVKKPIAAKPVVAKPVTKKPVVKKPVTKKRNTAPKVVAKVVSKVAAKVKPAVAKSKPATAKITKRRTTAALPVVKSKTVKVTKVAVKVVAKGVAKGAAKGKVAVKKAVTKISPAARAKTPVATLKKTAVKKPAAKKPLVKKTVAKIAVAKKPTVKKSATNKTAAKPATGRRKAGG